MQMSSDTPYSDTFIFRSNRAVFVTGRLTSRFEVINDVFIKMKVIFLQNYPNNKFDVLTENGTLHKLPNLFANGIKP